jgi:predicted transcriptional regulator
MKAFQTILKTAAVFMTARDADDLTDAERSVMEVLWSSDNGGTVRDIVVAMYGRHEHSLHGGVKSFLDRLNEKGYIRVDKSEFAHRFFARIGRQEFVGRQLKQIAKSHFGGSLAPMLMSLVGQVNLTKADRAVIEDLIQKIRN